MKNQSLRVNLLKELPALVTPRQGSLLYFWNDQHCEHWTPVSVG